MRVATGGAYQDLRQDPKAKLRFLTQAIESRMALTGPASVTGIPLRVPGRPATRLPARGGRAGKRLTA